MPFCCIDSQDLLKAHPVCGESPRYLSISTKGLDLGKYALKRIRHIYINSLYKGKKVMEIMEIKGVALAQSA